MINPIDAVRRRIVAPVVRDLVIKRRRDFTPAIVVGMDGDLGRRMWKYAIGRGASLASKLTVLYDTASSGDESPEFETAFPDLTLEKASPELARSYRLYFFTADPGGRPFVYDERVFLSESPRFLGGRYLNAKYIEQQGDGLKDEFVFKPVLSEEKRFVFSGIYMNEHPVAVHFAPGVATARYFRAAAMTISERIAPEKAVFFVFSGEGAPDAGMFADTGEESVFVEGCCAADMYLMSRCRHFIISNSTFGWWPAWLSSRSSDKIVVMPDKWLAKHRPGDSGAMAVGGWTMLPAD